MAGGEPGINDLYEVDVVQCKADGTEVWGKLLCNGPASNGRTTSSSEKLRPTFVVA